jgi:hypothetical protein
MSAALEITKRRRALLLAAGCAGGLAAVVAAAPAATDAGAPLARPGPHTIGLALTGFRDAFVVTPGMAECGGALDPGMLAQMRATPGALDRIKTEGGSYQQYGPNGESPQYTPLAFADPAGVPELVTSLGYGVNLDGTADGRATAKTCRHQKFDGIEGDATKPVATGRKVDNQLARALGCVQGYRTGGHSAEFYNTEVVTSSVNRHLIEIRDVDDEVNDPHVEVFLYKGYDRLVRSGDGKFIANLSQRIDDRYPRYNLRTTGRIENGVLITDPIKEALLPRVAQSKLGDRRIRDFVLRLKLTSDGADGIMAGYDDVSKVWNILSRQITAEQNKMTFSTVYRRLHQFADGYPDAAGQCTHISSTFDVKAVRAMIVHPEAAGTRVARNERAGGNDAVARP